MKKNAKSSKKTEQLQLTDKKRFIEIKGVLILLLAIFSLAACLGLPLGRAGELISSFFSYICGRAAFIIPLIMAVMAMFLLVAHRNILKTVRFFVFTVLCLCFLGMLQMFSFPDVVFIDKPETFTEGGGLAGYALYFLFYKISGSFGSALILISGVITCLFILFNFSVRNAFLALKDKFTGFIAERKKLTEKKLDEEAYKETYKEVYEERKQKDKAFVQPEIPKNRIMHKTGGNSVKKDRQTSASGGVRPMDTYNSSDFRRFNQGIKNENAFEKIKRLGNKFIQGDTFFDKASNKDDALKEECLRKDGSFSTFGEYCDKKYGKTLDRKQNGTLSDGANASRNNMSSNAAYSNEADKKDGKKKDIFADNANLFKVEKIIPEYKVIRSLKESGLLTPTATAADQVEESVAGMATAVTVATASIAAAAGTLETAASGTLETETEETVRAPLYETTKAPLEETVNPPFEDTLKANAAGMLQTDPVEVPETEGAGVAAIETAGVPETDSDTEANQLVERTAEKGVYKPAANSEAGNTAENQAAAEEANSEPEYIFPPVELLRKPVMRNANDYRDEIRSSCAILEQTLADFKVKAGVVAATRGPSVTRFELEPAPGIKVSSVVNLSDDIALRLAAPGVRIEAPIPGKAAIGIEVPNKTNDSINLREVVDCKEIHEKESPLCIGLGRDISGNVISIDLSKMPHLLVAGSTGSGKSVCINSLITGIMYKATPDEVKLILVDPKVVELSNYNGIPHLLVPVVTDAKKAASALYWAVQEMERRYQAFADNRVRDITGYNKTAVTKMPYIVIVIDELSDLMMVAKADVEDAILRLAQKARAAGIHLVLATQRPSVDVITGIVKANIPSRIAFAVSSQTDSRTILDMGGAEKLLGKGDMLFYPVGVNKPIRVQGAFVSDEELNSVTDFIKKQAIPVKYSEEVTSQKLPGEAGPNVDPNNLTDVQDKDEYFEEALKLVLDMEQASSSMLQRRFRIGYTRAARIVDCMEDLGIVGPPDGSKPRELLMDRQEVEAEFLNNE